MDYARNPLIYHLLLPALPGGVRRRGARQAADPITSQASGDLA